MEYGLVDIDTGGGPFQTAGTANVTVDPFNIGRTEVTYELWYGVKYWAEGHGYIFINPGRQGGDTNGTNDPVGTNRHPVTNISWRDAVVWCNAYSEVKGKTPYYYLPGTVDFTDSTKILRESQDSDTNDPINGAAAGSGNAETAEPNPSANGFRLPTNKEWEYAARGGVPIAAAPWTNLYAGTDVAGTGLGELVDFAWYRLNSMGIDSAGETGRMTHPVGTKLPNKDGGLYDMSGNVWEFCQDEYDSTRWLILGGSWYDEGYRTAVNSRTSQNVCGISNYTGFRVVSNP
jgi:formylglycine-generating enzyme required for sulfatase activity